MRFLRRIGRRHVENPPPPEPQRPTVSLGFMPADHAHAKDALKLKGGETVELLVPGPAGFGEGGPVPFLYLADGGAFTLSDSFWLKSEKVTPVEPAYDAAKFALYKISVRVPDGKPGETYRIEVRVPEDRARLDVKPQPPVYLEIALPEQLPPGLVEVAPKDHHDQRRDAYAQRPEQSAAGPALNVTIASPAPRQVNDWESDARYAARIWGGG